MEITCKSGGRSTSDGGATAAGTRSGHAATNQISGGQPSTANGLACSFIIAWLVAKLVS